MKNIYKVLTISILMFCLTMPMVKHILYPEVNTAKENRKLAQLPKTPKTAKEHLNYPNKFENFLTDNFGFRKNFIRVANKLRYYLFNETTIKQITIGKNGFIFLNSHNEKTPNSLIKRVCNADLLPIKDQNRAISAISEFLNYYNNLGYKTSIAIIPTKSRIYPENLPNQQSAWCEKNKLTWIDKRIGEVKEFPVYYPIEKFKQWKKEFQVYLPKHFHWHGELPYRVAEDIMKSIWNIQPDFNVEPIETALESDLKIFLRGLHFYENSVSYNYKELGIKKCRGKTCTLGLNDIYAKGLSFNFSRKTTMNRRLLLLTDSFGPPIAEHFIRGFDEVTMINLNHLILQESPVFFQTILKQINPTHFLYLFNDGGINSKTMQLKVLLSKLKKI